MKLRLIPYFFANRCTQWFAAGNYKKNKKVSPSTLARLIKGGKPGWGFSTANSLCVREDRVSDLLLDMFGIVIPPTRKFMQENPMVFMQLERDEFILEGKVLHRLMKQMSIQPELWEDKKSMTFNEVKKLMVNKPTTLTKMNKMVNPEALTDKQVKLLELIRDLCYPGVRDVNRQDIKKVSKLEKELMSEKIEITDILCDDVAKLEKQLTNILK